LKYRRRYIKALDENTTIPAEQRELLKKLCMQPIPRTRADCRNTVRPCLRVSCRWHLFLDVNPETGTIKFNFPDREVWELEETCTLDVAERGGVTLEELGAMFNLTRERIRQVEVKGMEKLKQRLLYEKSSIRNLVALVQQSDGSVVLPEISISPEDYRIAHIFREIIQARSAA
jgi:hypothetical protein